jgi:hypothetical protein
MSYLLFLLILAFIYYKLLKLGFALSSHLFHKDITLRMSYTAIEPNFQA